jgi:ribosomal protein S18 acetylase RimI-like enzyme
VKSPDKNDTTIRQFNPKDLNRLLYVFRLNVPEYFAPTEEIDFKDYIQQYPDKYFTILCNEVIAGGAGYKVNMKEEAGAISWIFLHPDYLGKGIGEHAVNFLLNILKKREDVRILRAETSQFGYKFFGSFGFMTVKTEKNYWGKGLDLYRMEMTKN